MSFPTTKQLKDELLVAEEVVDAAVEAIRRTVETALKTRTDGGQIVERFQNKIKHGMMVYSDQDTNVSWVRDFIVKLAGIRRKVVRKNRNFEIPIDLDKAE